MVELSLSVRSPAVVSSAVEVAIGTHHFEVGEELPAIVDAEVVEQTSLEREVVVTVVKVVDFTDTYVRNEVPNAVFVVAEEEVRSVDQYVNVAVERVVERVALFGVGLTAPCAFKFNTETYIGGSPFTNESVQADSTALVAEGVLANT